MLFRSSVTSIVDRFLEHSRILYFDHGGEPLVFISSADWMPRNLDRRVELLVPVEDAACRARLITILQTCFLDNVKVRRLMPDGSYARIEADEPSRGIRAQEVFCREATDAAQKAQKDRYTTFEPQLPSSTGSSR